MSRLEPRISGVGSDRSANCTTTTAQSFMKINFGSKDNSIKIKFTGTQAFHQSQYAFLKNKKAHMGTIGRFYFFVTALSCPSAKDRSHFNGAARKVLLLEMPKTPILSLTDHYIQCYVLNTL